MRQIYVDHFATTAVDERVIAVMLPLFREEFGNPASDGHAYGQRARATVELTRDVIREAVGAPDGAGVIFTSGATESNNLIIRGLGEFEGHARRHIVVSTVEHKSVLEPVRWLASHGYRVTPVHVDSNGVVDPAAVKRAIQPDTLLISVMAVNNETGTIQPVREIGEIAKSCGVAFHCDASQAIGKIPIHMQQFGIDYLSISAHKLYGPKGTGALCLATSQRDAHLAPQELGGGQEAGLRSGTLNVPGIAGLARAIELMSEEAPHENARIRGLRNRLVAGLEAHVPDVSVNGSLEHAIPGALNISIAGIRSTALLARIQDIAVSGAAACGGQSAKSHVLLAMGLGRDRVRSALRFGIGRFNTIEDIDTIIERIASEVAWIRTQPVFAPPQLEQ